MATVSIKKSDGSYEIVADTRVTDYIAGGGGSPVVKKETVYSWEQYNSGWRATIYDEDITDSSRVIIKPTVQTMMEYSQVGFILFAGELEYYDGNSGYFYVYAVRLIMDNPENPVEPISPPGFAEFYYYQI